MFTGINDPGPWQWFVKRTDNAWSPFDGTKEKIYA